MKKYKYYLLFALCLSLIPSCALDNYAAPDSSLHGKIIDVDTQEPIPQDLILGSEIDFVEQGFENPNIQTFRFSADGSFRNDLMFKGKYVVHPKRGNFIDIPADTVIVDGNTEHIFEAKPYIRINNPSISFDNIRGEITATFKLDASNRKIDQVLLLADKNPNVGMAIRESTSRINLKRVVKSDEEFLLKMSSANLESGEDYYFRIAALIADVGQAKHNFSSIFPLSIDNTNVIPQEFKGKMFDDCESTDLWSSSFTLSLDGDSKQGFYSLKAERGENGGPIIFMKKRSSPFDATTEVDKKTGHFSFSFFISDVSKIDLSAPGEIEITSSGGPDQKETRWEWKEKYIGNLVNGWNEVVLPLKDATYQNGECDLSRINFMRIFSLGITGPVTFKIDKITFY